MTRRFINLVWIWGLLAGCSGGSASNGQTSSTTSTANTIVVTTTAKPSATVATAIIVTTTQASTTTAATIAAPEFAPWTPNSRSLCKDLTGPDAWVPPGRDFGYVGTFIPDAVPTACFKLTASHLFPFSNDSIPCQAGLDVWPPYNDGYLGLPLFGLDVDHCQQLAAVGKSDIIEVWATLRSSPGGQFLAFEEYEVIGHQ